MLGMHAGTAWRRRTAQSALAMVTCAAALAAAGDVMEEEASKVPLADSQAFTDNRKGAGAGT